jgi:hypothetical protein
MRKIFTLTIVALLSGSLVFAQSTTKSGKKRWGHFGLKSGANFSGLRLNGIDTKTANAEGRTGFVVGAFESIPVDSRFTIQPEFVYSAMGGTISTGIGPSDQYRLNYFSMPILVKYNLSPSFAILGGTQLDFIIKAKKIAGDVAYNATDDINAASVAVTWGAEYWFGKSIVLQGRYIYGINDVNKTSTTFQMINKGFQLTLGFQLQ